MSTDGHEPALIDRSPSSGKVDCPGRHPCLPDIYVLESHTLVPTSHGTIYLMVQDFGATATKVLFETVANMTLPRTEAECTTQGNVSCTF